MASLLIPLAPRNLNTAARVYHFLVDILAHPNFIEFVWDNKTNDLLGARTHVDGNELLYRFTRQELREVCAPIEEVLFTMLASNDPPTEKGISYVVRTVWRHCSEPTTLLSKMTDDSGDTEVYSGKPFILSGINIKENCLDILCIKYVISLRKKDNGEMGMNYSHQALR